MKNLTTNKRMARIAALIVCLSAPTSAVANPVLRYTFEYHAIVPVLILWFALAAVSRCVGRKIKSLIWGPFLVAMGYSIISMFFSMEEAMIGSCQVYLFSLLVRLAFQEPDRRDPDWSVNLGFSFFFWLAVSVIGASQFGSYGLGWSDWAFTWRLNPAGLLTLFVYPAVAIAFIIHIRLSHPRRRQTAITKA